MVLIESGTLKYPMVQENVMKPALQQECIEPHSPILPSPPRVDVYRNLNDDCLSVRSRNTDDEMYGTVVAHTQRICLKDVSFVVQEETQQKAKDNGSRNVHAFARGHCREYEEIEDGVEITYRPFDSVMPDTFSTLNGEPVESAERLVINLDNGSATMIGTGLSTF